MGKKILLFGTGLLAEVLSFYLRHDENLNVDAFTVDGNYCREETFLGAPLIPFEDIKKACPPERYSYIVAVGYAGLNTVRENKAAELDKLGYTPMRYISSKASIASNVTIPEGCIIFENVCIQPFVTLKKNILIWSNSFIGHHSDIGNACFIGAGAMINGGVKIGDRCLIGSGAIVREFVSIGENSIVGAGSVLLRDMEAKSICNDGESDVKKMKKELCLWPPRTARNHSSA